MNHYQKMKIENQKINYSIYNEKTKNIILNNRRKYTSKKYDITIIEIKKDDKDYFELEINEDNIKYNKESIYILHYPYGKNISISYGIINTIFEDKEYEFKHCCTKYKGSSG